MLAKAAALFAKPAFKIGAAIALALGLVIGALLVVRAIYSKGETAGASGVTNAVQTDALRKLDEARKSKEKTDEEVRRTPYDDRADGLR